MTAFSVGELTGDQVIASPRTWIGESNLSTVGRPADISHATVAALSFVSIPSLWYARCVQQSPMANPSPGYRNEGERT
jgi:hypothetical protein